MVNGINLLSGNREFLSHIYKFNPAALAHPLRRNVVLSLKDITRKQILASLKNNTKMAEELELPKSLVKYISNWKLCDQDLDLRLTDLERFNFSMR